MSSFPSIDSELLRTFVAIADHGGFTRAAEVVNRTQSAVSMQMKRLEEDVLERTLFERDGRQVRLTPEGQVLLGYARRILRLQGEVFNTLRQPHMVGAVRIGTPDDYVMRFLPEILSRFALEESDTCLHHFNCALLAHVPLQGKLYVYPSRLCFFSRFNAETIVGAEATVLVLPYARVKRVAKHRGTTFDNALAVELVDGGATYILTSFLQRDRAFRAIRCILEQAKEGLMERLWLEEALKLIEETEK